MKMIKGYTFRMYPNEIQKELIEKSFGISRYIYNYFLKKSIEDYKKSKISFNAYQSIKELPELSKINPWLKEVDSCLLRTSIFDLEDAYKRYFKTKEGYPKLKRKYRSRNSYRTNNIVSTYKGKTYHSIELDIKKKEMKLPKLKKVKIRGYRNKEEFNGRIINATIYKEAKKYYVSVCVEEDIVTPPFKLNYAVGIDVGIKDLIVTSDGIKYNNEKVIKKYERQMKGYQKSLARKERGSKNFIKVIEKLRRVNQKLKNARKYNIHEISKRLVEENDIIVCEKLDIKEMTKNHRLAKSITDASWGEIIRQIAYKSKWKNKQFLQIEQYYASSQIGNRCGYKNEQVKNLNVRNFKCKKRQTEHDRDINASINIMYEGILKYYRRMNEC